MSKVIAIAFSDLHIHDWKSHNTDHLRLRYTETIIEHIGKLALKYDVPIFFPGDFYDNPKSLEQYVFTESIKWFKKHLSFKKFYAISGNHDMCEKNTFTQRGKSYLEGLDAAFTNFHNMDFFSIEDTHNGFAIHGIPYLNGNNGLKEAVQERRQFLSKTLPNILMIHTDLPGAKDTDGRVVESHEVIPEKMDGFFKGFQLVLSGHIHYPQQLSDKVYMLGAPYQQRSSDMDTNMGYWLVYDDMSMKFKPINFMPVFKYIDSEEERDSFNFCILRQQKEEKTEQGELKFSNKMGKEALAKKYLKAKGIKSKSRRLFLIDMFKQMEK